MGLPLKLFNELCTRQKKRRIDEAVQADHIVPPIVHAAKPTHRSNPSHVSVSCKNPENLNDSHLNPAFIVQCDYSDIDNTDHIDTTASRLLSASIPDHAFNLRSFLADWCIKNKIAHCATSELLVALQKSDHPDLPGDARTLLGTPTTVEKQALDSGTYCHFGLERALRDRLWQIDRTQISPILRIMISTDGLPLSKSSKSDLWLISGKIVGVGTQEPFLIAAFHGSGKPSSAAEFLVHL